MEFFPLESAQQTVQGMEARVGRRKAQNGGWTSYWYARNDIVVQGGCDHRKLEGQDRKMVQCQTQRSVIFLMKSVMLCLDISFSKPYYP